jgi:hypothetical protein
MNNVANQRTERQKTRFCMLDDDSERDVSECLKRRMNNIANQKTGRQKVSFCMLDDDSERDVFECLKRRMNNIANQKTGRQRFRVCMLDTWTERNVSMCMRGGWTIDNRDAKQCQSTAGVGGKTTTVIRYNILCSISQGQPPTPASFHSLHLPE